MIRLAKAHARLRLSEKVEEKDIDEAISLMKTSLKSLGFNLDRKGAGKLEALDTGMTRDQKDKVTALWKVIRDLTEFYEGKIPVKEFKQGAEGEGISEDFASEFLKREINEQGNLSWVDKGHIRVVNPKW